MSPRHARLARAAVSRNVNRRTDSSTLRYKTAASRNFPDTCNCDDGCNEPTYPGQLPLPQNGWPAPDAQQPVFAGLLPVLFQLLDPPLLRQAGPGPDQLPPQLRHRAGPHDGPRADAEVYSMVRTRAAGIAGAAVVLRAARLARHCENSA